MQASLGTPSPMKLKRNLNWSLEELDVTSLTDSLGGEKSGTGL